MPLVAGSISVFGVRPRFAEGRYEHDALRTAASASTAGWPPGSGRAVRMSRLFTWSGVSSGWRSSRSAITPDTTGADIEVPPARRYSFATAHCGHREAYALPGASVETMWAPGA